MMTSFSNYGEMVDICAPGAYIFSTVTGNTYECYDGTSMAASSPSPSSPVTAAPVPIRWTVL